MKRFDHKVVFITGASSGIGAGLAREFHRQGAHLVLTARRVKRLKELADELNSEQQRVIYFECDVTDSTQVNEVFTQACKEMGKLDVVIANAGFGVVGDVEKLTLEDYKRQFATNIDGVIRTAHAAIAPLKKTKGNFVIMGSVTGYVSLPGGSPYSMSKFAVRAFSDSLYLELAPFGIAVTYLAPGFVVSEIRQVDNKGKLRSEMKEPLPKYLVMPTQKAAKKMVTAIYRRKREQVITAAGCLEVFLMRHVPWLMFFLIKKSGISARSEPKK